MMRFTAVDRRLTLGREPEAVADILRLLLARVWLIQAAMSDSVAEIACKLRDLRYEFIAEHLLSSTSLAHVRTHSTWPRIINPPRFRRAIAYDEHRRSLC